MVSRELKIFLLVSFLWHLFWMSVISIVFLPKGLTPKQYSPICFLGSILRDPVFRAQHTGKGDLVQLPSEARLCSSVSEPSLPVEREILNPEDFIEVDIHRKAASMPLAGSAKRPDGRRQTIFQPPFPNYPEWVGQKFRGDYAVFKMYISAGGLVEQTINVQGSGDPEVDAVLARYIGRWRFAPVSQPSGEWQTVKINLGWIIK
jgi:hypothetical protein